MQAWVIPNILFQANASLCRDVCVTAPTGSGKTLTYVLPILHDLASYQLRLLRALVVLPSRDLAMQVHKVFEQYAAGSTLKIGLAIGGQGDFRSEQIALTIPENGEDNNDDEALAATRAHYLAHYYHPGNHELALEAASMRYELQETTAAPSIPRRSADAQQCA